jgi:hypothetical protein
MCSLPNVGVRVIAAVALANVVEDYEAAFRQAGYQPGVVMPSMLAALGAAHAEQPSLVIKVDARTTSTRDPGSVRNAVSALEIPRRHHYR